MSTICYTFSSTNCLTREVYMNKPVLQNNEPNDVLALQERNFKLASFISQSDLVPKNYRNKPANVFVAMRIADNLQIDPIIVMQGLYEVHGKFGWDSKSIIGLINRSGIFKGGLNFEADGIPGQSGFSVTCFADRSNDGALCQAKVTWDMAVNAGWTTKNAAAYKAYPEQMITYRAAAFFARKYCPEIMFGYHTTDELRDINGKSEPVRDPEIKNATPQIESKEEQNDILGMAEQATEMKK